jgi:hypothetical protein
MNFNLENAKIKAKKRPINLANLGFSHLFFCNMDIYKLPDKNQGLLKYL